jgi:cyclase
MLRTRVIPCLLLKGGGLVKTIGFKNPSYVGDPINAVRIFSEKEVDELVLLDIEASKFGREPDYEQIRDIVSEAFMPVGYGGGVTMLAQARRLAGVGVEKIIVDHSAIADLGLVREIADSLGSQSTVVAVDVKRNWRGQYRVYDAVAGTITDKDAVEHMREAVAAGAGEVFVNDVVRDGTGKGYDIELVRRVAESVDVPVVVCGGAAALDDLREAAAAGASGVAAGSMFVYLGRHRAVMINYPAYSALREVLGDI